MGVVFEAYQSNLRRKVALKVLDKSLADRPGFKERFAREAATAARITHRNVVRIYDILSGTEYDPEGAPSPVHVIAMEFIDGPHLRRLSDTEDPPLRENIPKAADYFRQICAGVAAAHEQGVVHRDLKPENIMLDRESGLLKVTDFGLAYFVDRDAADAHWDTRTRMTMGTVAYMPPEQRKDAKRVLASGDVYSLGRLLYELFIGALPDGVFTPASQVNSDLPEAFDKVVERCLKQEPDDRFQTAGELLEALDEVLAPMLDSEAGPALEEPDPVQPEEPSPPELELNTPLPLSVTAVHAPFTARFPLWALLGAPLVLGLVVGALVFGSAGSSPAIAGDVWLLEHGRARPIAPITVIEDFTSAVGGIWTRADRFLDHRAAAGEATIAQQAPAKAIGRALSAGRLMIERRIEWSEEGDEALRSAQLGTVKRLIGVGFSSADGAAFIGIDAAGKCFLEQDGDRRACGLGRAVRTPARFSLRQVRDRVEITVDNLTVLPERLKMPSAPANLLLLCQNQRCRFDPKRR
jgi:hypothetical protein